MFQFKTRSYISFLVDLNHQAMWYERSLPLLFEINILVETNSNVWDILINSQVVLLRYIFGNLRCDSTISIRFLQRCYTFRFVSLIQRDTNNSKQVSTNLIWFILSGKCITLFRSLKSNNSEFLTYAEIQVF